MLDITYDKTRVDMACKCIIVLQKTRIGHSGAIGRNAMTMEPYTDPKHALVRQNMAVT